MTLQEMKSEMMGAMRTLENPGLEARVLMKHQLGMTDVDLILKSGTTLDASDIEKLREMTDERLSGRPSAYITGEREFYGYRFHVTEDVLIPQPDTEILVETALGFLKTKKDPEVLDLCTGSGCIIASIKAEDPSVVPHASDISPAALGIAEENHRALTGSGCDMRLGSLFEPWKGERFDLIATNPPYVTEKWYEDVDIEVKHEPLLALIDHAADGLDLIREIIRTAPLYLKEGGMLIIESDHRQCAEIRNLLRKAGFSGIETKRDLAGRERSTLGLLL